MTVQEMVREIRKIPGSNGWWRADNGVTFQTIGMLLVSRGLEPAEALEILEALYGATADEFGA